MIEKVKKELAVKLAEHDGTVGLFFSGGSDSLLLLHILLDMKAQFAIVQFDYSFTREQKRYIDSLIDEFALRVFSYKPRTAYLVGDGKQKVAMVEEYPLIDGSAMPFIRDCLHDGKRCAYDVEFDAVFQERAPVGFTLNLFGTRRTDRHWTTGKVWNQQESKGFYAPLWDWTRRDVRAGLTHYGAAVPTIDTGSLPLCTACMTATGPVACPKKNGEKIEPMAWFPTEMLTAFKTKYGRV